MKIALDLLCCSKRMIDAVVAHIPLGTSATGSKAIPATDADGNKKEKDSNNEPSTRSALADLPHSRVFVYVPSPPGKAFAGDEFDFFIGSIQMKARYLCDKGMSTSAGPPSKVAAVLPHEAIPEHFLSSRLFSAIARPSDPRKLYVKAPPDFQVGENFLVSLFGQKILIRCPKEEMSSPDPRAGGWAQKFRMFCCCPKKKTYGPCQLLEFQLKGTCFYNSEASDGIKLLSESETEVSRMPNSNPPSFLVTIPDGVKPGQQFPILVQGQHFLVTCPMKARPRGTRVRIVLPMLGYNPGVPKADDHEKTTEDV
jgi:hypothetical protein